MSKDNRILLAGLAVAALLPLVVGGMLGWPHWVTVPLFAAVLGGTYRLLMHGNRTVTDHVGALLDRLGFHGRSPVRHLTAHRIAQLVEATGNPRAAGEIRGTFDTLSPDDLPSSYRTGTRHTPEEAERP